VSDVGKSITAPVNSATTLPRHSLLSTGEPDLGGPPAHYRGGTIKRMFSIGWMTNTDVQLKVQARGLVNSASQYG
jgi:hypothetical protein